MGSTDEMRLGEWQREAAAGVLTARRWAEDTGQELAQVERPSRFDGVDKATLRAICDGDAATIARVERAKSCPWWMNEH